MPKSQILILEKKIFKNFLNKYKTDENTYNIYLLENIIYNDNTRVVSAFKENLIIEDDQEYIKRFYNSKESFLRLNKYISYYTKYCFIFPNYTVLPESKYIYQNLNDKQRVIDDQRPMSKEKEDLRKNTNKNKENLFENSSDSDSSSFDSN